jgi:hypothetical protein
METSDSVHTPVLGQGCTFLKSASLCNCKKNIVYDDQANGNGASKKCISQATLSDIKDYGSR